MEEIGSAAAVLVAAVLLWAAIGKWHHPGTTAASFAALGVPYPSIAARAVPVAELLVSAALMARPSIGGWLAFAMLAVFTALLVPSVVQGREVGCACFGSAKASPVSPVTLVRNAMMMVAAFASTAASTLTIGWAGAIAVGTAAVMGLVLLALGDLRRVTGALFPRAAAR